MTEDQCRPVEVDGEIIRVHGGAEMDETDRAAFAELVRAVKRRFEAESLPEARVFPQTDPPDTRCNLFSLTPPDLHSRDCGESPPPDPVG